MLFLSCLRCREMYYARNLCRSVLNNFPKFHSDWMNGVVMHKEHRHSFLYRLKTANINPFQSNLYPGFPRGLTLSAIVEQHYMLATASTA
ncbi:hypothetical protein GDO78_021432 [Eleutherodactylus coqui]|uniref:Uncharacterized protein n=1 Tax=Eleutherodactylus coqui TaxID=57060 RepID=A0A8J6BDL9_ELECQ|nr:hypothetical protein GDO78_021432 [Eleutherodactylus coqui]